MIPNLPSDRSHPELLAGPGSLTLEQVEFAALLGRLLAAQWERPPEIATAGGDLIATQADGAKSEKPGNAISAVTVVKDSSGRP